MTATIPNNWKHMDYSLQDFVSKFSLPQIVNITRGEFYHVSIPRSIKPSLDQSVLLVDISKRLTVVAQSVKLKKGHMVMKGRKMAIPENFEGWFEILNENGDSPRCIEQVRNLLKTSTRDFLLRAKIKASLPKKDWPQLISNKTKTLHAGDILTIDNKVYTATFRHKPPKRYLKCVTGSGQTVFLKMEQKGKFSPIAGPENISGVHSLSNLLTMSLPLTVRLIQASPLFGLNFRSDFVPAIRLESVVEVNAIMALPRKGTKVPVALSPSAPLWVRLPNDIESFRESKEGRLYIERGVTIVKNAANKIRALDICTSTELPLDPDHVKRIFKQLSEENNTKRCWLYPNYKIGNYEHESSSENMHYPEIDEEDIFGKIDYIYALRYEPFPENESMPERVCMDETVHSSPRYSPLEDDSGPYYVQFEEPEPPPVETTPVKSQNINNENGKTSPSSADRHVYDQVEDSYGENSEVLDDNRSKPFVPAPAIQGMKKFMKPSVAQMFIDQKSQRSPDPTEFYLPHQRAPKSRQRLSSPLFDVRYKSLVNIMTEGSGEYQTRVPRYREPENGGCSGQNNWISLQRTQSLADVYKGHRNFPHSNYAEKFRRGKRNRKRIDVNESIYGKTRKEKMHLKALTGQLMKAF